MTSKTTPPKAGDNTPRSLDVIGADLRKLRNVFDSGELLAEAKKQCNRGDWLTWLETYFDGDDQTARNHIAAYRLSLKYLTIRDLKVPVTVIYRLVSLAGEGDKSAELTAIIKALVEATQTESIGVIKASAVIRDARLRYNHGDYHDATLDALESFDINYLVDWEKKAIKELKKQNPDTKEAATAIENAQHRAHLETIFGAALPKFADDEEQSCLSELDNVKAEDRQQVLARLQAASEPLNGSQVSDIIFADEQDEDQQNEDEQDEDQQNEDEQDEDEQDEGEQDEDEQDEGEPPATSAEMLPPATPPEQDGAPKPAPKPTTRETDPAAATAANAARSDIGADSKGENARLRRRNAELENDKRVLEIRCRVLEEDLKDDMGLSPIEQCVTVLLGLLGDMPKDERGKLIIAILAALNRVQGFDALNEYGETVAPEAAENKAA